MAVGVDTREEGVSVNNRMVFLAIQGVVPVVGCYRLSYPLDIPAHLTKHPYFYS